MPEKRRPKQSRYDLITGQDNYASQTAQDPKTARRMQSMIPQISGLLLRELAEPIAIASGSIDGSAIMNLAEYDANVFETFVQGTSGSGQTPNPPATIVNESFTGATLQTDYPWIEYAHAGGSYSLPGTGINLITNGAGSVKVYLPINFVAAGVPDQGGGTVLMGSFPFTLTIIFRNVSGTPNSLQIGLFESPTADANIDVTGNYMLANVDADYFDFDNLASKYNGFPGAPIAPDTSSHTLVISSDGAGHISMQQDAGTVYTQSAIGAIGLYSIELFVGGSDNGFSHGASEYFVASVTLNVTPSLTLTTTSFTAPIPTSANYLVPVTFIVNVSGGATPTGNIIFTDGVAGPTLATVALDGSGNASYTSSLNPISALYFGLHEIYAKYQGDSNHDASYAFVPFFVNPGLQRHYFAVSVDLKLYELNLVAESATYINNVGALGSNGLETGILSDIPQFTTDPLTGNFHLADGTNNWLFDGTTWVREGLRIPTSSPSFTLSNNGSSLLTVNQDRFYWTAFADETPGRQHDSDTGLISAGTGPINTVTIEDTLNGQSQPISPNTSNWSFVGGVWRTNGSQPSTSSPMSGYGFNAAISGTDTIAGVLVSFFATAQLNQANSTVAIEFVQLQYNGNLIGAAKNPNTAVTQQSNQLSYGAGDDLWGTQATITEFSINGSNVVTFQAVNFYNSGDVVVISGLQQGTYLNGQSLTVSATGLSGSQFEASFTHAAVAPTTDSGFASLLTPTVVNDSTFGFQVQFHTSYNGNRLFFGGTSIQLGTHSNTLNSAQVFLDSGTITTSNASPAVVGVATQFTQSAVVGDVLYKDGASIGVIATIGDDNNLTLAANAASTNTSIPYTIAPPRATHWHIWASESDGSQVGFYLASVPITTTSYVDFSPFVGDPGSLFLEINRPVRNDPPVGSHILEMHKRRLWRRQDSQLNYYTFSAAEEVQALDNGSATESNPGVSPITQSDIINEDSYPDHSRVIRAMKSHADALYIGTESQVIPLFGESIEDFALSQIAAFAIGVGGRFAMISTPQGLVFVSYDKKLYLYPTSNYPWAYVPKDVNVTEQLIEIGKPLRNVLAKIKSTDLDNIRLKYYNFQVRNWLVLCFQDNTSNYQTWVYEFDTKTWIQLQRGFTSVEVFEVASGEKVLMGGAPDGNIYVVDDLTGTYSTGANNPATLWRTALIDFGDPDHKHVMTYLELELTNSALAADLTVKFYLDPVDADNPTASVPTRIMNMLPVPGANLYRGFFTGDGGGSLCQRAMIEIDLASSVNAGGFRGVKFVADVASSLIGSPLGSL